MWRLPINSPLLLSLTGEICLVVTGQPVRIDTRLTYVHLLGLALQGGILNFLACMILTLTFAKSILLLHQRGSRGDGSPNP